jgi:enamine deaminase RidA (YjgF/YER057c/UK114 family)
MPGPLSGARRHVPFGAGWSMPVDVNVSEWVVDRGIGWSCGQCPLDLAGGVTASGDVEAQAQLVAERILSGLARAGLPAEGLLALIVYGVEPDRSAAILGARMPAGVVMPVGVPPLYYPGMTLEVDVIAAEQPARRTGDPGSAGWAVASASGLSALAWRGGDVAATPPAQAALAERAGRGEDKVIAALLALPGGAAVPEGWSPAAVRRVPPGAPAAALLLLADGAVTTVRAPAGGVALEVAEAGPLLRLTAWCRAADQGSEAGLKGYDARRSRSLADPLPDPPPFRGKGSQPRHSDGRCEGEGKRTHRALGAQADAAMAAIAGALAARGLGPQALVKVTAHHLGEGAAALHESLAARHRYHARPAPASTGLGVAGLVPEGALVVIEAMAAPPYA